MLYKSPALLLFIVIGATVSTSKASPILANSLDDYEIYPTQPNEVLPIQPVLLYPSALRSVSTRHQGRKLDKDNDIIYVKLLKRRSSSYRPVAVSDADSATATKELTMKDIYYVKAPANGQFSTRRFKVYRIPEFYAISVFHKGDQKS